MNVYASVALSGDGYMDDRSPRRLILSTPADWRDVMRLRAWADAILVYRKLRPPPRRLRIPLR